MDSLGLAKDWITKNNKKPMQMAGIHRAGYAVKQAYVIVRCKGASEDLIDFRDTETEAEKLVHEYYRKEAESCEKPKKVTPQEREAAILGIDPNKR